MKPTKLLKMLCHAKHEIIKPPWFVYFQEEIDKKELFYSNFTLVARSINAKFVFALFSQFSDVCSVGPILIKVRDELL
jgi:hypothetical protein